MIYTTKKLISQASNIVIFLYFVIFILYIQKNNVTFVFNV